MKTLTLQESFAGFELSQQRQTYFRALFGALESYISRPVHPSKEKVLNELCYEIVSQLPLPISDTDCSFIVRARPNDTYNPDPLKTIFRDEHEISYNSTRIDLIRPGRFNALFESMFYGALPSCEDQGYFVCALLFESFKYLIEPEDSPNAVHQKLQYFTFGKWFQQIPNAYIPFVALCFDNTVLSHNPRIMAGMQHRMKKMKAEADPDTFNFVVNEYWKFLTYLASARTDHPNLYVVTTALMHAMNECCDEFNGIIYPSSMTKNKGVNIVLTPNAVDRHLRLGEAFMYKFTRSPSDYTQVFLGPASSVATVKNHKLHFNYIW